jgi:hypothetical protein
LQIDVQETRVNKPSPSEQVRLIIETAFAELKAVGADHDNAAMLLAIQGMCRIGDNLEAWRTVKQFADESHAAYLSSEGETLQ